MIVKSSRTFVCSSILGGVTAHSHQSSSAPIIQLVADILYWHTLVIRTGEVGMVSQDPTVSVGVVAHTMAGLSLVQNLAIFTDPICSIVVAMLVRGGAAELWAVMFQSLIATIADGVPGNCIDSSGHFHTKVSTHELWVPLMVVVTKVNMITADCPIIV